ncbi:unnamed protein product [Clonostachys rosea]|uniref:F-box domain-containing protein n=1 Tax=Bionectria ochroleuca TaxID=29856 RepID=A0ABY6UN14_BIOOC|nr:unnamed protein product [Clonostachys rosea]
MASLEDVPPEIFDIILAQLQSEDDIYHLVLTCREMHNACIDTLYRVNAFNILYLRPNQPLKQRPSALDWAIRNGVAATALRVIELTPKVCNVKHVGGAIKMEDPIIANRLLGLTHLQQTIKDPRLSFRLLNFAWDAIEKGHMICLGMLESLLGLEPGMPYYLDKYILPALSIACRQGHVMLVDKFVVAGSRQPGHPSTWLTRVPLVNAIRYRGNGRESNYEMAKVLLTLCPELATTSLLFAAAQEGHHSVLQLLLEHGAQLPSDQDHLSFLLFEAIRGGCLAFVQTLVQNGASIVPITRPRFAHPRFMPPNNRAFKGIENAQSIENILGPQQERLLNKDGGGRYVLSAAISADNLPLVRFCVSVSAHIDNGRQGILSYRISSIDMLECIFNLGININSCDEDGILPIQKTLPLLSHCIDDPILFFDTVASKMDDIDDRNVQGKTVLAYCCAVVPSQRSYYDSKEEYRCIKQCVEVLLDRGAKVDLASDTGRTPLHEAAQFSSTKVVSLLLKHGANPNALDEQGRSPLHCAMAHRCQDVIVKTAEILLKRGADPNHRDHKGTFALHIPASCVNRYYAEKLLRIYLSSLGMQIRENLTDDGGSEMASSSTSSSSSLDDSEDGTQDAESAQRAKSLTDSFVWRQNDEGATPAVVVARYSEDYPEGHLRFCRTDRGFNVPDAHGLTPVAAALLSRRYRLADWLVKWQRADLNWLNDQGQTVLDILSEHSATNPGTSLSMSKQVARSLGGLTSRELAECHKTNDLRDLLRGNGSEEGSESNSRWWAH